MSNTINTYNQKFQISANSKIGLYFDDKNKEIYYEFNKKQLKKVLIPKFVFLKKKKLVFILEMKDIKFKTQYLSFCKIMKSFFEANFKMLRKRLILKGLGFKMILSEDKKSLNLKVGLSYIVNVKIPKKISIFINKKILTIEGYDKVAVGNFLYAIRQIRSPESYKEKGF